MNPKLVRRTHSASTTRALLSGCPVFTPRTHELPQHTADLSQQSINFSPSAPGTSFSSAVRVDPENLL